MLKIVEQTDLTPYQALLDRIQTKNRLYLTEALENGQVTGHIVYAYEPEQAVIYDVEDGGDLYLCDGLVRSVLFKAELRGLEKAYFALTEETAMEKMRKLRFVQNDENILPDIREIMENCKKCKKSPANT